MSSSAFLSGIPAPLMPTGGGQDQVFYTNGKTVTVSWTIPSGQNAMTTGPIVINSGITLTVPSGSKLVVL